LWPGPGFLGPAAPPPCQWSGNPVCSAIIDQFPDYELDDVLVVQEPKQLRALGDFTRGRIIGLLGQRAASTTELAAALDMPKGTVGHHLKVLEKAGLIRVVRTRQVRALTEKYYGRVARLFELKGVDTDEDLRVGAISAMMLRHAADEAAEAIADEKGKTAIGRVRLTAKDAARFTRRLDRLQEDFRDAADPEGELHVLSIALFRSPLTLPPGDGVA
jgi:DNA-binding transcriptional ArsR family regulator